MTRLLLLIPTTSYRTADFVGAAHALAVEVAVGSNQRPVLEAFTDGATLEVDFGDLDAGVAQIEAYARDYPLAAIVGVDDVTAVLAATAAAALGLPHNPPDAVATTTNKYRLRTALANSGLAAPSFRLLSLDDDAARAATEAPYPCVLKPLSLAASRGVIRADNPAEFVAAAERIARILEAPDVAPLGETARQILIESYIPGVEVALEGLLVDGELNVLALFDKPDPLEGPFFEETIYTTPSRLAEADQRAIVEATRRAVAAVGLRDGPIHAELRVNARGPWVIEVAARSIGGLCARVLRFGAGVSLEELILRHAIGLENDTLERERRPAGVMMLPIPDAGVLRTVAGVDAARAVAGVDGVTITLPVGQAAVPLPEGNKYLGFIFAHGATPDEVEATLREANSCLDVTIDRRDEA